MNGHDSMRFDFEIDAELGEHKIPREDEIIDELVDLFKAHFKENYPEPNFARRAVHAKSHGCLKGTFEVLDHGDPDLQAGIFGKPAEYESVVRFTNGDGPAGSDTEKLVSVGLGIKVLGVTAPKLLPEQLEDTQDFLMINQPRFIVADIRGFLRIIEAREGGLIKKAAAFIHHLGGILNRRSASPKGNPLDTPYWSVTAFQLGDTTVKYLVRPKEQSEKVTKPLTHSYLRELIKQRIKPRVASFDFLLQKRLIDGREQKNMPIENNTVTWDEGVSKPIEVAKLTIPAQDNEALDEDRFCENLFFTPWNTTERFRPLGSLNRARKVIYELSSGRRHEINKAGSPCRGL